MPPKILIADDERHIVRLWEVNFRRLGYEVVTAFDGREALQKVEDERPALVVLDRMMPYMDGFEVLRNLRANPETAQIPVIMLGPNPQAPDVFGEKQSGVTYYTSKPFDASELLAFIVMALTGGRGRPDG